MSGEISKQDQQKETSGPLSKTPNIPESKTGEIFSNLPEEHHVKMRRYVRSRSAPLPSPDELRRYEEILPGLADRIVKMAEKEQDIRKEGMQGFISNDRRRIRGSVVVSLFLIVGAVCCAVIGQSGVGGILGVSGVVPVLPAIIRLFMDKLSRSPKTDISD